MKKAKKIFAGVFIAVLVVALMGILDRSLELTSEVQQGKADFYEERNKQHLWGKGDMDTPKENEYMDLKLEELMVDGTFGLEKLKWGRNYTSIDANWGYGLKPYVWQGTIWEKLSTFGSKETRTLDGIRGDTVFYFASSGEDFYQESELKAVGFHFPIEEDADTWYQAQYDALVKLYGPAAGETEPQYGENGKSLTGCRWVAGDTSLQLLLLQSGEAAPSTVIIRLEMN